MCRRVRQGVKTWLSNILGKYDPSKTIVDESSMTMLVMVMEVVMLVMVMEVVMLVMVMEVVMLVTVIDASDGGGVLCIHLLTADALGYAFICTRHYRCRSKFYNTDVALSFTLQMSCKSLLCICWPLCTEANRTDVICPILMFFSCRCCRQSLPLGR